MRAEEDSSPLGDAIAEALERMRRGEEPPGACEAFVCAEGRASELRLALRKAEAESRRGLPPGVGGWKPGFVEPAAGFSPRAEALFLDLYRVAEGPDLVVAYKALRTGRLRRAYSHSGFLRVPHGRNSVLRYADLRRDPVLSGSGPGKGGPSPLERLVLAPLARDATAVAAARAVVDAAQALAGADLELVRWYALPAPVRSPDQWRARTPSRSAEEEGPYVDALLALLDRVDARLLRGLSVHDPACHDGTVLERLGTRLPWLDLGFSDVDPHFARATARRLAAKSLLVRPRPASPLAIQEGVPPRSVDLALVRALNRGVVTYTDALAGLARTARTLRPGGIAAVWGFSFPLLNTAHFEALGLTVLNRTLYLGGSTLHTQGVVPFYLLMRPE